MYSEPNAILPAEDINSPTPGNRTLNHRVVLMAGKTRRMPANSKLIRQTHRRMKLLARLEAEA
jgi:hypothetical protein